MLRRDNNACAGCINFQHFILLCSYAEVLLQFVGTGRSLYTTKKQYMTRTFWRHSEGSFRSIITISSLDVGCNSRVMLDACIHSNTIVITVYVVYIPSLRFFSCQLVMDLFFLLEYRIPDDVSSVSLSYSAVSQSKSLEGTCCSGYVLNWCCCSGDKDCRVTLCCAWYIVYTGLAIYLLDCRYWVEQ